MTGSRPPDRSAGGVRRALRRWRRCCRRRAGRSRARALPGCRTRATSTCPKLVEPRVEITPCAVAGPGVSRPTARTEVAAEAGLDEDVVEGLGHGAYGDCGSLADRAGRLDQRVDQEPAVAVQDGRVVRGATVVEANHHPRRRSCACSASLGCPDPRSRGNPCAPVSGRRSRGAGRSRGIDVPVVLSGVEQHAPRRNGRPLTIDAAGEPAVAVSVLVGLTLLTRAAGARVRRRSAGLAQVAGLHARAGRGQHGEPELGRAGEQPVLRHDAHRVAERARPLELDLTDVAVPAALVRLGGRSPTTVVSASWSSTSTRPCTTCTSTSSGARSPSETNARSSSVLPSSGTSPTPPASTWSTRTADHAARTRDFHAASSRAPA